MKTTYFVKATQPPKLALPAWWWLPIGLGGVYALMALTQLANFEGFVLALESYRFVDGTDAIVLAIVIAAAEILSLPALFRLLLSPAMRWLSAFSVVLVPILWIGLAKWALLSGAKPLDAGFLGAFLPKPFGVWSLLEMVTTLAIALFALYILGYLKPYKGKRVGK